MRYRLLARFGVVVAALAALLNGAHKGDFIWP